MGYSQTTIVVFGIEVTDEQAKNISEKYINEDGEINHDEVDVITNEVSYHLHGKPIYETRDFPNLLADEADSRVDDMSYSEGSYRHVFGIQMASRGYGCPDRIENYISNVPDRAKQNYVKYILPILREEGIEEVEPSVLIVTQVW